MIPQENPTKEPPPRGGRCPEDIHITLEGVKPLRIPEYVYFRCPNAKPGYTMEIYMLSVFSALSRRHLTGISGINPNVVVRTLSNPLEGKKANYTSVEDAVSMVKSGDSIHVHGCASTPTELLDELCKQALERDLKGLKLSHILTFGNAKWIEKEYSDRIRSNCIFTCANMRKPVNAGIADYIPVFLSESIRLYDEKALPLDVAFITVSPPDAHGYCSLGVNVDCSSAAARNAKKIIAIENPSMPLTFGDSVIHVSQIDALVKVNERGIYEMSNGKGSEEEKRIGKLIAENLVDNGATLQMGIGAIPDSSLAAMANHKDLGIHSEMISDGVIDLIKKNVVTNNKKTVLPGQVVTSFAMGSRKFYDFLDGNPQITFASSAFTNDVHVIAEQSNMTAINSCIEIDLTGQICSDSIGTNIYSGFGGQVDFIYGTAVTKDRKGKPIIALTSQTNKGISKIVPTLKEGSGVVTTRGHVRYVVTEYGIAQLWGKNLRQRAYELIQIAHPNHREELEKAAFERLKCMPSRD
ncbi:hypothetical protein QR680_004602 [Steinernema hermaphroditum]|uniref:Acetyl-CoA hydrolase n=1 Tax=Steinernema hermaphroditum TaxID=289476 RepID=A0AA39LTG0_9BILA|nr:hypothetical protein QR680_004602 [Steinernema hermaphroditum]